MSWTKIWNEDGAVLDRQSQNQAMTAATFLLEARRGTNEACPMSLWSGQGVNALSVATQLGGAVELRHRDLHLQTEPGVLQPGEAFRLTYHNLETGAASLELRSLDRPGVASLCHSQSTVPPLSTDFVPAEPVVTGFAGFAAVANHNAPRADRAGLQAGTLVETPAGTVRVDHLAAGDVVSIADGERAIVQNVEQTEVVSLGSMNAVRLRAPYFGLSQDLYLARHTPLQLSGPEIDYVFGVDQVTANAGDLVNNVSILRDLSEPVRDFVSVELDRPGCLQVGRLSIATKADTSADPVIDRASAQSLLAAADGVSSLLG